MHSNFGWNEITQSESLMIEDMIRNMCNIYYGRTQVYVFLFSVKKTRSLIIASLTLKVTVWGTSYVVFIGTIFHDMIETWLKRVGHCVL